MSHFDITQTLNKLQIETLNPMQQEALATIPKASETMVLSPTGTGKTLAFLLPLLSTLDPKCHEVQALILAPSRELALQIEQVIRKMGAGFKANAVYGGRAGSQDKIDLKHRPAVLIGTPGRIADHLRKESFPVEDIETLVLDEFDKSLEVGFEAEMSEIVAALPYVRRKVLTSATQGVEIPEFVEFHAPKIINFLAEGVEKLAIKTIVSPNKDKLQTLVDALSHLGNQPGIIFCNFKDSIDYVSDFLADRRISHACFHGGLEQRDREKALIKFRNGTHQLLVATDLAARGIDVPEIKFILHYQLPHRAEDFVHRNGRTARMNQSGTAYVLHWEQETLPDFIQADATEVLKSAPLPAPSPWTTLYISGGRRDKISKGDIAGLFFKKGGLDKGQLGVIEIKPECAYVAVDSQEVDRLINQLNNQRLKKKKVRLSLA